MRERGGMRQHRALATRQWALMIAAGMLLLTSGCAGTGKVQAAIEEQMKLGNYPAALQIVEEQKEKVYDGKNRLLYYLERGMLLQLSGDYEESNITFQEAKRIGEDLYTKSLSSAGLSLMTNDYSLDYAGENFERTLIHLFSALNYKMLGDSDSALVEIRQVGDYLRKLQVDTENENVYQEDAFARYLSALLYESQGELDSALVAYKKALGAYDGTYASNFATPRPTSLAGNARRVAAGLGGWAQDDLAALGVSDPARILPEGTGEVVLLHYNGLSPIKDQDRITIPFSDAWLAVAAFQAMDESGDVERATAIASSISSVDIVSVAFPKYVDRAYAITAMKPRASNALDVSQPELVEDIGAIAEKDLADRIVRIRTKAIARAAIKYALQKAAEMAAEQVGGDYGSLLSAATQITGNIARYASEQADKRVWSTLPDQIWMSSVVLPAGTHDVDVDFMNAQQTVVETRNFPGVEVRPGERQFLLVRTVQ